MRKCVTQLKRATEPSATYAVQWKRFLTEHKQASNTLCQSVADVAPDNMNNLRDSLLIHNTTELAPAHKPKIYRTDERKKLHCNYARLNRPVSITKHPINIFI